MDSTLEGLIYIGVMIVTVLVMAARRSSSRREDAKRKSSAPASKTRYIPAQPAPFQGGDGGSDPFYQQSHAHERGEIATPPAVQQGVMGSAIESESKPKATVAEGLTPRVFESYQSDIQQQDAGDDAVMAPVPKSGGNILNDFDLRSAVVFSEILKPKF